MLAPNSFRFDHDCADANEGTSEGLPPVSKHGDGQEIELRGASMFKDGRMLLNLGSDNPLRELTQNLRAELHDFIHINTRPQPRMGFDAVSPEPVKIDGLIRTFDKAVSQLEKAINDPGDLSPESFANRGLATNMQANIEEYLVALKRIPSKGGLNEGDLDSVLHNSIALKQHLSGVMLQMDALSAGMQISS